MEDKIQINGIWYIREGSVKKEENIELNIVSYVGCAYEDSKFLWEATKIYKDDDKSLYDGIDIKFFDKTKKTEELWDNENWAKAVLEDNLEEEDLNELQNQLGFDGLKTFKTFLQHLRKKGWI